jgi:hypothetical protein
MMHLPVPEWQAVPEVNMSQPIFDDLAMSDYEECRECSELRNIFKWFDPRPFYKLDSDLKDIAVVARRNASKGPSFDRLFV